MKLEDLKELRNLYDSSGVCNSERKYSAIHFTMYIICHKTKRLIVIKSQPKLLEIKRA